MVKMTIVASSAVFGTTAGVDFSVTIPDYDYTSALEQVCSAGIV